MGFFDSVGEFLSDPIGTVTGKRQTREAIAAQERSASQANETQKYMYDTTRKDLQPWRETGVSALSGLQDADYKRDFTMSDFQNDPGYAFRMAEGQKAIERSAAAKGSLNSGATLKSLARYSQGVASDEYNNAYNRFNSDRDRRFNRLSSLAGIGQTANSQVGSAGQNYANQVSGNQIGLGNAIASANIAEANRLSGLIGQGAGAAALYASSDARLKTNIEPITKSDLKYLKNKIKAYSFNYKSKEHGDGEWIGVMAQDLEKTKFGKYLVSKDKDGFRQIDIEKAVSLILAILAEEAA